MSSPPPPPQRLRPFFGLVGKPTPSDILPGQSFKRGTLQVYVPLLRDGDALTAARAFGRQALLEPVEFRQRADRGEFALEVRIKVAHGQTSTICTP